MKTNNFEFPQADYVHHDSKTDEPLQKQIQTFSRWQDHTIEEYKKEIEKLNNIIKQKDNVMDELEKYLIENIKETNADIAIEYEFILKKLNKLRGGIK